MKILMITGIFPPDIGGPATYVPTMARELVKRGHNVAAVTLSDTLGHDDRLYGFPVHRIRRGLFKPLRFLVTVLRIFWEGRGTDVLYVNGLFLEAVVANYLLRKPMVQKIVGDWAWESSTNKGWVKDNFDEFQRRKHDLKVELRKALQRFYARRAHRMIVASRYFAHHVAGWGVAEEKISIISNAVEAPPTPLLRSESIRVPLSTSVNVVTVSRLVPWKHVDELIDAVARCEGAGLVIIGDGPERGRLEELVQRDNLADRVYFAGSRNREETFSLMAACDLFALNSSHETFSHVVLEAMSVGLPVVARAIGPIPDLVHDGENGVLITREGNGQLSESLRRLIASPRERERLSTQGHQTVKAYGCEVMVGKTEQVLSACAH
jgi:glycosyltransferase involved in cell wall biosynthesis